MLKNCDSSTPGGMSGGVPAQNHLGQVIGDRCLDPRLDNAVHACPVRIAGRWRVLKDMVLKGVLAGSEEELIAPAIVLARIGVEDNGDQVPDVLQGHGLGMEVGDGGSLMETQGMMEIGGLGLAILLAIGQQVFVGGGLSGGTLLGGAGHGVASARSSSVALSRGGLGFLLGGGGAGASSRALRLLGSRTLTRSSFSFGGNDLGLAVGIDG